MLNLLYYKSRSRIIVELIDLFRAYFSEISFNKNTLDYVISKRLGMYSKNTQLLLNNYKDISRYPAVMSQKDKSEINSIFCGVGKLDVENELEYVTNCIDRLNLMLGKAKDDTIYKGELRSKLILIFGLILIIMLL
ncbi:MAG: hypothetical protein E7361_02490 [Clostridiales bacterium]|nr:hypothetical protein [Clostridiales bacterium]